MLTRSYLAAWGAVLPFFLSISTARAQTNLALTAPPSASQTARFGIIEIDESRAQNWGDFIHSKDLKKQIANLQGALVYREGALGFYRVGFEAVGDRAQGRVRVSVTIVGQNGDQTILATGQSTQRWSGGAFLYEEPQPNAPRPGFGNNSPAQIPAPTDDAHLYPTRSGFSFAQAVAEFCKSREEKTGHDDDKKSRDDDKKSEEKRAPNPEPKREEKSEPKRAPDPKPEPRREEPKREERPQPQRDERPEWERKTKPRREDPPQPQPALPPIETPRAPQPQPEVEPKRAPNPQPPRVRRPEAPRPNPPTITLPPLVSAPNPNPAPPRGNTTAPDPNPPSSRTVPLSPNPNPPNRGGVHQESRPPRRRVWNDPYGRYPYPYPDSYPYPYPYPVPYPSPYPVPYPAPTLSDEQDGARQAFDYALIAARAEAEADFDRQLTGEDAPENQW